MRIQKIVIHNYRNLDSAEVSFADDCNFIVGENNLGKSNLLSLLSILFSRRSFDGDDFADTTKPIEVSLKIGLADIEIGHFQDLFDVQDYTAINLVAKQTNPDELIEFYHQETNTYVPSSLVRLINYVHYNSLRNPIEEINFDKGRGVGRFLNDLVCRYLKENNIVDKDFLDPAKVSALITALNNKLTKIKAFKDFDISAVPDDNIESLLCKVLIFKDGQGGRLTKAGYGIQFLILVTLSILDKIQSIMRQRKERGIFQSQTTGEKSISIVLGFDEPEIHLHPYMQRALIKYLNSVIGNQNLDFKLLIKDLFGIDSFVGQIIVVTQSPNIILNDFKQIIRFYPERDKVKIVSGAKIVLDEKLLKHLYLNFPFIKEAFFSRCAIFVEGDSEYASLPVLAGRLSTPVDFDGLGICVIQAHGNAIPQLLTLASLFGIQSVGITDKDTGATPPTLANHFQTNLRNFEEELVSVINTGGEPTLRRIVDQYDPAGTNAIVQPNALNKWALEKYSVVSAKFTANLKLSGISLADTVTLKAFYLTWFSLNKSYPLGKMIGENLSDKEIPLQYRNLLNEAVKLVQNA